MYLNNEGKKALLAMIYLAAGWAFGTLIVLVGLVLNLF